MAPEVPLDAFTDTGKVASLNNTGYSKRAYVAFLAGNGDYVKGVVGLAKGLRKAKSAYPLVVAILPDVPEDHRDILRSQGCIVREIEPIYPPENETQFAMAYYVINYSKLRIWDFEEYSKMVYLDADIQVYDNIDHLFDMADGSFYAVMDCFCEKTWSHSPQYSIGYCQQRPDKVTWPAEMGSPPPLYFNAGMFVFEPSRLTYESLLETLHPTFGKAISMLQQPFEQFLEENHADWLVSDMFLPWTRDVAAKFGIPRLVFHGTSFFSLCVSDSFRRYAPHQNVASDTEPFTIPGLPDQIEMTRLQLPDFLREDGDESPFKKLISQVTDSDERSFGVIVNSFYELEPTYVEHYRKIMGRKAWHIGPVSLCNRNVADKAQRGMKASIDRHECLSWLDSKKTNSVLYICFGSVSSLPKAQLLEIAMGLESSGHPFIWVVRNAETSEQQWLPQGFEQRMEGRGLIIRGWAPQVLILDHQAIGGFMTHCGWNSVLEGASYGVPMITWPIFAEQFYNEKLVTEILRAGIRVGAPEWVNWLSWNKSENVLVKREAIEKAVNDLMDYGEEAERLRSRARELREMAQTAVEEGGSSYTDWSALIDELTMFRRQQEEDQ